MLSFLSNVEKCLEAICFSNILACCPTESFPGRLMIFFWLTRTKIQLQPAFKCRNQSVKVTAPSQETVHPKFVVSTLFNNLCRDLRNEMNCVSECGAGSWLRLDRARRAVPPLLTIILTEPQLSHYDDIVSQKQMVAIYSLVSR